MAEMRIEGNRVLEMANVALAQIEANREAAHQAAIQEVLQTGREKWHWWRGNLTETVTLEEATEIYAKPTLIMDHFYIEPGRERTDARFNKLRERIESLTDLALRALAFGDGYIVLDTADAKLLLPSSLLTKRVVA